MIAGCVFIGSMFLRRTASGRGNRIASVAGLFLLSLLWACTLLRWDLMPGSGSIPIPFFERQALPLIMLALLAGVIAIACNAPWPQGKQIWVCIQVGLGLFVVPATLLDFSDGRLPGVARTALLTLVPVFVVVFEPYIGKDSEWKARSSLLTALAGVVGALLVFPVSIPDSTEAGLGFVAVVLAAVCVAAANCLGVAAATQLETASGARRSSAAPMAAIAGATAAVGLVAASLLFEQPVWKWNTIAPGQLWTATIETPTLVLLFWLMRRISATRMAARYVLAPLLAILIGVVLLRSLQDVRPRTWLGLFLMAASAGWLLFGHAENDGSSTLPLNLNRNLNRK